MIVLRLVLTSIVLSTILWALTILLGPKVMTHLIDAYYGEDIKITEIKIKPTLEMSARRIEFVGDLSNGISFNGIDVNWSLLAARWPSLKMTIANARTTDGATAKNIQLQITPSRIMDAVHISGDLTSVRHLVYGGIEKVSFTASTDWSFRVLKDLVVKTEKIHLDKPIIGDALRGTYEAKSIIISELKMLDPIDSRLELHGLSVDDFDMVINKTEMETKRIDDYAEFAYSFSDVSSEQLNLKVREISGYFSFRPNSVDLIEPLKADFKGVAWNNLLLPKSTIEIDFLNERFHASAEAEIAESEVFVASNYYGKIPASRLSAEIEGREFDGGVSLSGEAILNDNGANLVIKLHSAAQLNSLVGDYLCLEGDCDLSDVVGNYEVLVNNEGIYGNLRCSQVSCSSSNDTHTIKTDDTSAFFSKLEATKLLSPMILGIGYARMLGGEKIGAGHEIYF